MHVKTWQAVPVLTLITCVLVTAEIPAATRLTTATLSLALGASALVLMGSAALLGGRWKLIESQFGGLDRVYQTHKWLGIWALGFASFHLAFKAGLDVWDTASIITLPAFHTRLVRQSSYIALMLIIMLALNRNIPYHLWRWWHKLSGPLFLIVVLHWLSIKSPIAIASPAGIWIALVAALGVTAAAYKLLLYPHLSGHAEYRIVAVTPGASAVHMELAPVDRTIDFEPGQFGFITMKKEGFREPHPFTIASGNDPNGNVHFLVRALGDYTRRLVAEATVGSHADIYAPFGRFKRRQTSTREVWIAGGVGISPFVAWLKDRSATGFDRVSLFYFFTPGREFPSAQALADLARQRGAQFMPVSTGPSSPEFIRRFGEIARESGAAAVGISFCGPKGLMKQIHALMREHGIPRANLRYEYFEFR